MRVEVEVGMEEAARAAGGWLPGALAQAGVAEEDYLDELSARCAHELAAMAAAGELDLGYAAEAVARDMGAAPPGAGR